MLRAAVATVAAAGFVFVGAATAIVPGDPNATHPAYAALNMPAAWDITTGSPDVVIAIVDSGVDATHPDLAGAVLPGYDLVEDKPAGTPSDGHGTGVAGAAAARADNGIGGAGTCFRCSLLALRVVGNDGIAFNTTTARAIDYAVDHGAAVVNASIYGPNLSEPLRRAIQRARAAGVLVVAAAGNEGDSTPQYPAAFPETISVGASTFAGARASFSSYGSWVGFAAPECAPISVLGGTSGVGCMTSVSSPLVAGIIGLMRAQAPFASADQIETALIKSALARPVPGTRTGVVDAAAALRALGSPEPRLRPVLFGDAVAGRELEVLTGIWAGAKISTSYQWERCRDGDCSAIAGATRSRYTLSRADLGVRLRAVVTMAGVTAAASPQTPAVASAPRLLARPSISGSPRVGARLVAHRGRWQGTTLEYVVSWQRCRASCIQVATGRTYRPAVRDRGARVRIEVVAHNSLGAVTALSKRTGVVR
jgi:subtilisin family serine protease